MKFLLLAFLLAVLGLIGWGVYRNRQPRSIGIHEGQLSACPSTPNCVSSYSEDSTHSIKPFPIAKETGRSPVDTLVRIIQSLPGSKIIQNNDRYIHAEFRSKIFSFVDDVEFLLDNEEQVIHVRSASRVGYGDLGVNRDRVELIREEYMKHVVGN